MIEAAGLGDFSPLTIAAAAAMTFGASYVRGLTGFGMAIILVPLLGLLIAPEQAVVLAILLQLLIGPVGLRASVAQADKASALPIGFIAMAVTPLGMWLLSQVSSEVARLLITASAVAAFVAVLLPKKKNAAPAGKAAIAVTGAASGLLTGFAAMPGPPVVPFYLRGGMDPQTSRASMMTIFFLTAIAGTLAALWLGIATPALFLLSVILFAPMWLGNRWGGQHFGTIKPALWQAMVAVVLGVAAVSAVLRAL